jgi:hypothetical protein
MGLVSIPVARWFVLGCLALGGAFAVLLRFAPKSVIRPIVGAVIVLIVAVLWWQDVYRNDRMLSRRARSMSNQLTLRLRSA